jgi:transposase-like protein
MQQKLHKNARTTLAIRKEIKESNLSINELSKKLGLSWDTVKKWKASNGIEDISSRPHNLNTTLTKWQEDLILFERRQFKKPIDEIFFALGGRIPNLYPMKVYRCLRRYGLNVLPQEFVDAERKIKKFRKYTIGYLHIDVLYAPKINKKRWYLFTCIDRVSKVAYVWVSERKTKEMGARFLRKVLSFYLYPVHYILTDNGFEFCYDALPKGKKTTKVHPFTKLCRKYRIQHRRIKFRHPWTNGMIERFNGKVRKNVLRKYLFSDVDDLKEKLTAYINDYNFTIRLKGLGYKTPADYLKTNFNHSIQCIVI